eukprot:sb/3467060/
MNVLCIVSNISASIRVCPRKGISQDIPFLLEVGTRTPIYQDARWKGFCPVNRGRMLFTSYTGDQTIFLMSIIFLYKETELFGHVRTRMSGISCFVQTERAICRQNLANQECYLQHGYVISPVRKVVERSNWAQNILNIITQTFHRVTLSSKMHSFGLIGLNWLKMTLIESPIKAAQEHHRDFKTSYFELEHACLGGNRSGCLITRPGPPKSHPAPLRCLLDISTYIQEVPDTRNHSGCLITCPGPPKSHPAPLRSLLDISTYIQEVPDTRVSLVTKSPLILHIGVTIPLAEKWQFSRPSHKKLSKTGLKLI